MIRRRRRPTTYKKRPVELDRQICEMALNIAARKVEVAKANNGGVVKYKAMTDIVESMKPTFPWLTKSMLRNHMNKINKMMREAARATAATAMLSSLTFDTAGSKSNTVTAGTTMEGTGGDSDKACGQPKGNSANRKQDQRERAANELH